MYKYIWRYGNCDKRGSLRMIYLGHVTDDDWEWRSQLVTVLRKGTSPSPIDFFRKQRHITHPGIAIRHGLARKKNSCICLHGTEALFEDWSPCVKEEEEKYFWCEVCTFNNLILKKNETRLNLWREIIAINLNKSKSLKFNSVINFPYLILLFLSR